MPKFFLFSHKTTNLILFKLRDYKQSNFTYLQNQFKSGVSVLEEPQFCRFSKFCFYGYNEFCYWTTQWYSWMESGAEERIQLSRDYWWPTDNTVVTLRLFSLLFFTSNLNLSKIVVFSVGQAVSWICFLLSVLCCWILYPKFCVVLWACTVICPGRLLVWPWTLLFQPKVGLASLSSLCLLYTSRCV